MCVEAFQKTLLSEKSQNREVAEAFVAAAEPE
jgi:hypothetical protein